LLETINPKDRYDHMELEDLHVLIISKPFDAECQEFFLKTIVFLQEYNINLYSNSFSLQTSQEDHITSQYSDKGILEKVEFSEVGVYTEENDKINRVITLGGDGTILYAIKMFYNK
jgi:NAD kinase